MAMLTTTREERGEAIAKINGQIQRVDDCTYTVKSQSNHGEYCIVKVDGEWVCECADNKFRHVKCKHIIAVELSTTIRAEVKVRTITPIESMTACVYCVLTARVLINMKAIITQTAMHNDKWSIIELFDKTDGTLGIAHVRCPFDNKEEATKRAKLIAEEMYDEQLEIVEETPEITERIQNY